MPTTLQMSMHLLCSCLCLALWNSSLTYAVDIHFERVQLTNEFHAEGGTTADLDKDGHGDVIVGPWIYWGPQFETRTKFYEAEAFDPAGYSRNFIAYSDDIDGDQLVDTVVLGFPGEQSHWYRNPGKDSARKQLWERFTLLDVTDNESPMLVDIDGDKVKDVVCSSKGFYGYASHAGQDPTKLWKFTPISPNNKYHRFTHGIGVGDVNNDGRMDLMEKDGWWENPGTRSDEANNEPWKFHKVTLAAPGGSQMFAIDLDGDGKNEILTGLAAHGFGLVYYRVLDAANDKLEKVEIMTSDASSSPVGIAISQLHAIDVADINRDGIPDIVTGKRWWAHAVGDDGSHMPATLVWFETQRSAGRVHFIPHVIDNSSGVGTQVMIADVNGDKLLDIVSGNKRGAYAFLQKPQDSSSYLVSKDPFDQRPATKEIELKDTLGGFRPAVSADKALNFDFENGKTDWEARGSLAANVVRTEIAGANEKFAASSTLAGSDKPGDGVGELISRPFQLNHPWLSALVSGGKDPKACVEVVSEASGQVIGRFDGTEDNKLQRQWLDLSSHKGTLVRIRLVDHLKTPVGFAQVDDIRLHDKAAN